MDRTPLGCDKLGSVEGIGADAERALEEARNQAANEGGTHIVAGRPHVDVEHGMFTALPATVFKCAPDWTQPPANGYP